MGTKYRPGFTIVETVMFLAVTGLLVTAILVSTGSTINVQRYRDSVSTLKSYIQDQYSEVFNVRNEEKSTDLACDSNAVVTGSGDTKARGQGDCVVIGRFTTISDNALQSSTVVGFGSSSKTIASDIDDLSSSYKISLLPGSESTTLMEWGTRIAWPASGPEGRAPTTPRDIAILILRSPRSGVSYTFTTDNINSQLEDMIVQGDSVPGQAARKICVNSDGLFDNNMSILINAFASNQSAVETRSNDLGDASQC